MPASPPHFSTAPACHVRRGEPIVPGRVPLSRNSRILRRKVIFIRPRPSAGAEGAARSFGSRIYGGRPAVTLGTTPPYALPAAVGDLARRQGPVFFRVPFLKQLRPVIGTAVIIQGLPQHAHAPSIFPNKKGGRSPLFRIIRHAAKPRYRKVTICALVQSLSGSKVAVLVPLVTLLLTAHWIASA